MAEEALVRGDADLGAGDLALAGRAPQLPGQLADLRDRLGWDGFAWAGTASPKHESPPDGFTGTRPPISVAPLRSMPSASPGLQSPMFSYQSSSSADERS